MAKAHNVYDNAEFYNEYKDMRDSKINANDLIEIPIMKEMMPDLKDKTILDLGCGAGGMSRYFVECGAKRVVAVDISQNMIKEAKSQNCDNIEYQILAMEDIDKIKEKFDIVFSSLAFHYVENFSKLIKDIYALLKPNGILLYSQEHPFLSASILKDGMEKYIEVEGKRYYLISDYSNMGIREKTLNDKNVNIFHRDFSTIFNTLINAGFNIVDVQESRASREAIQLKPKYIYEKERPMFLFVKAQKK